MLDLKQKGMEYTRHNARPQGAPEILAKFKTHQCHRVGHVRLKTTMRITIYNVVGCPPNTHTHTHKNGGKENKMGKPAVFLMVVSLDFSAACLFGFSLYRFGCSGLVSEVVMYDLTARKTVDEVSVAGGVRYVARKPISFAVGIRWIKWSNRWVWVKNRHPGFGFLVNGDMYQNLRSPHG